MKDPSKVKPELIKENSLLKQKIKGLERSGKELKQPEEAHRESGGKLNAMLRSIPDHISVIDRELNIVWANMVATGMFGNDIIGRKCYEVYHRLKEPCEPYPCIVLKAFEDGGIHEHDTEVVDKEGKIIYFHCTANVVSRDKDNKPVTVLEISRDITKGRQAEKALLESENRFRRLAENARDLIYRVSLPDCKIEYVSPASYDMFGFTPEEYYNGTVDIKKAIHPDFTEYIDKQWKDLLRGEMPPFYEYKIIHKEKGERWLYERSVLIRDESGSPAAIEGIVTDITDRKRMEEELKAHRDHLGELVAERTGQIRQEVARRKEKEGQYLTLVESIIEWVWETDANFVHTYLSPRVHDILGYKPEELIGRSPADIMPPGEVKRARPFIRKTFSQKKPFVDFENVCFHKDGHLVFIEANGRPFFDGKGRLLGYRGSCRDVTRRKKTMEALKGQQQELTAKSKTLEEVNIALKVLLKQREEDKQELEGKFVSNVKEMVLPYIQIIKKGKWLDPKHRAYLDIATTNLNEIIAPFLNTVRQLNFTPKEIEVASHIKAGRTTKEIADLMGVAPSAVDSHRNNIRIKLGLNNKKANLRSHLLSLR